MSTKITESYVTESVADCHTRGSSVCQESDDSSVRTALVTAASWATATRATGAEIAWALRREGYETRLAGPEHVAVVRGGQEIARLPLNTTVHAAMVRALLRTLGISAERFSDYLADPDGRRDA